MDAYQAIVGTAHTVAFVLAWGLACLVLRAGHKSASNRLLAGLLFAEGAFQGALAPLVLVGPQAEAPGAGSLWNFTFPAAFAAVFVASVLYLLFLASLSSPLTRVFRRPAVRRLLVVLAVAHASVLAAVAVMGYQGVNTDALGGPLFAVTLLAMATASVYGLAACISAWRRAPVGTPSRARAFAFVLAFGGRDAAFALHILGGPILASALARAGAVEAVMGPYVVVVQSLLGVATIVFASFLAYGFLRSQLFDIDLKIKVGIRRSTAVTIGIVGVLAAAKVAEFYLSRTLGFVAGGVAAGILLVLTPRLNKLGDKVANAALPNVQATPVYLQFKKLEVYRAAVESSVEAGGIDAKQRDVLDRLRAKLALAESDTRAVEAEVLAA